MKLKYLYDIFYEFVLAVLKERSCVRLESDYPNRCQDVVANLLVFSLLNKKIV
jgi:hypothetical protein